MEPRVAAEKDLPHTAAAEAIDQDVRSDVGSGLQIRELVDLVDQMRRVLEEVGIVLVLFEHRVDLGAQRRIGAVLTYERLALGGRALEGVGDDVLRLFPRGGIRDLHHSRQRYVFGPPSMRRRSQIFAVVHSRLTVATEIFSTSAISSTVRPAKYRISTISAWRESSAARAESASCRLKTSTGSMPARGAGTTEIETGSPTGPSRFDA